MRNAALAVLVALVVLVGRQGYQDYVVWREVADREKTMDWLRALIIPKLGFHEATLEEAVASLNQTIAATPGKPKDLHIEIASANETAGFHPLVPEEKESASMEEGASSTITVELTAIPMIEALKYVTGLSNRMFHIHGHVIFIHPALPIRGTFDPLVTRTFLFRKGVEKDIFGESEQTASTIDVSEKLRGLGMKFYEGSYAELDTGTRKLRIHNTEDQISIMDMCADCFDWNPTIPERVMWWIRTSIPTLPSAAPPPPTLPNGELPPRLPVGIFRVCNVR